MNEIDEKLIVADAMKQSGGSFVQALGQCLLIADHLNLKKLKDAFPEYYSQYLTLAKAHIRRKENADRS